MLNLCLIIPVITASINGFDSSLINGTCSLFSYPYLLVVSKLFFAFCRTTNCTRLAELLPPSEWESTGYAATVSKSNFRHDLFPSSSSSFSFSQSFLTGLINSAQNVGGFIVSNTSYISSRFGEAENNSKQ